MSLPCIYDRNGRWQSLLEFRKLIKEAKCSHICLARPPADSHSQFAVDLFLNAAHPCYKRTSDDDHKAHCGREFESELWLASVALERGTRRRPPEPVTIVGQLTSRHPDRLRFVTEAGETVDSIPVPSMFVGPIRDATDIGSDQNVDDRSVRVILFPGQHQQYATVEFFGNVWPLGAQRRATKTKQAVLQVTIPPGWSPSTRRTSSDPDGHIFECLLGLHKLTLSDYSVVGNYVRYDNKVRNYLINWRDRIIAPFVHKSDARENFLIWAASSSGKSYLVEEIGSYLSGKVDFLPINIAKITEDELREKVAQLNGARGPVLCLLDEVDTRPKEEWLFPEILPCLDLNKQSPGKFVFALVGSTGTGMASLVDSIKQCFRGDDVEKRVPSDKRFEIPEIVTEVDRVTVALSQFRHRAEKASRRLESVEKAALYYVLAKKLRPHQLTDLAIDAVGRMSADETVLRYNDLFAKQDSENQRFWADHRAPLDELAQTRILIT